MNKNLEDAKELLLKEGYTCVIKNEDDIYMSSERGVGFILKCVKEEKDFTGYCVADKVVGKAAAFLYVLLKIDIIYAGVISEPAKKVLEQYNIEVCYDKIVKAIRNRTDTGFCPMETAVWDIDNPYEAVVAIENKRGEK